MHRRQAAAFVRNEVASQTLMKRQVNTQKQLTSANCSLN